MAGFFSRLFGEGKSDKSGPEAFVQDNLETLISKAGFDITFDLSVEKQEEESLITVNFSGADEELLKDRKGQLLDAFQLYIRRVVQHNFSEEKFNVVVDCGGYREETEAALIERAESLKMIAIEQGKAVYYRALPPKERKIVHQYLGQDERVKSRSLGDGLYKKIKIYPAKAGNNSNQNEQAGE